MELTEKNNSDFGELAINLATELADKLIHAHKSALYDLRVDLGQALAERPVQEASVDSASTAPKASQAFVERPVQEASAEILELSSSAPKTPSRRVTLKLPSQPRQVEDDCNEETLVEDFDDEKVESVRTGSLTHSLSESTTLSVKHSPSDTRPSRLAPVVPTSSGSRMIPPGLHGHAIMAAAEAHSRASSRKESEGPCQLVFRVRQDWQFTDSQEVFAHQIYTDIDIEAKSVQRGWNMSNRRNAAHFGTFRLKTFTVDGFWKQRRTIHPESNLRVCWEVLCLVLIAYEAIVIPMELIEEFDFAFFVVASWIGRLIWTLDIGMSFSTGVYEHGNLVMEPWAIARMYARTWFAFDLFVLLTSFFSLAFENAEGAVQFFRYFRFLRLLRMVKALFLLQDLVERWNSTKLVLIVEIAKAIFALFLVNHLMACFWYGVGSSSSEGWANQDDWKTADFWQLYFTSLGWALSNMAGSTDQYPKTTGERLYAVFAAFSAIILFSSFLGKLTNLIMSLQKLSYKQHSEQRIVRSYLKKHHISPELSGRVKSYLVQNSHKMGKQDQVYSALESLPENMLLDIHDEARTPVLSGHPLFSNLRADHPRLVRQICHHAMNAAQAQEKEFVFVTGDVCQRMIFMGDDGSACYRLKKVAQVKGSSQGQMTDTKSKTLGMGDWISEPGIWTKWEHCGDLCVKVDCLILSLEAEPFARQIQHWKNAYLAAKRYAICFVEYLNNDAMYITDLVVMKPRETLIVSGHRRPSRGLGHFFHNLARSVTSSFRRKEGSVTSLRSSDDLSSRGSES